MNARVPITDMPRLDSYDVVIVGGAIMGSSTAWWLAQEPGFDGTVLVVERDPTYACASTSLTNSCMRQQFSNEVNVRISQFGASFVADFRRYLGGDPEVPELAVDHFGYMYLAGDEPFADTLRRNQAVQASFGAGTRIMTPNEIAEAYPFYRLDDIVCGSHNLVDEGYFDGGTMFSWWRRKARELGVEYVTAEVTGIDRSGDRIIGVSVGDRTISCGAVVNASGTRAGVTAAMAGLELPVEPRKRYTWIFQCAEELPSRVPLTIDPSGVHVRSDGDAYMTGATPDHDPAVPFGDFDMDRDIFEDKVWPAIAHRIPAFERIKVTSRWAGHYAYNTLDHNAIIGPHHEVANFIFVNGFSGHGLQQSPAMGRGVSELVTYGEYRSLDLSPLGYDRIARGEPFAETAII